MNTDYGILRQAELFECVGIDELEGMLGCLGAQIKEARKDELLLMAGERPEHVGVVLSGQLHIVREDHDGNRALIAAIAPGGLFAEALCCAGVNQSPVSVVAAVDSAVMQLRFSGILRTCPRSCPHHTKLIENMLGIIAGKNLMLQSRMETVSLRSVRKKILRFLESFVQRKGEDILIPFNRDEMAEYLCVERSALSHELMRMKQDGLIEYRKNRFRLLG